MNSYDSMERNNQFSAMFKIYNLINFSVHPSPEEGGYMFFHHASYFFGSNLEAIWIYLVKSGFPGFWKKGFRDIIRSAMERRSILNTVFGHLEPKCDHNSFGHLQKCKVGSTQLLNTICLDDQDWISLVYSLILPTPQCVYLFHALRFIPLTQTKNSLDQCAFVIQGDPRCSITGNT